MKQRSRSGPRSRNTKKTKKLHTFEVFGSKSGRNSKSGRDQQLTEIDNSPRLTID